MAHDSDDVASFNPEELSSYLAEKRGFSEEDVSDFSGE